MAFDDNVFNEETTTEVSGSGNTTTNNSTNVAVDLDNVGNTDTAVSGSGNQDWAIGDSFNENFDNSYEYTSGSFNEYTEETTVSFTDASVTEISTSAGDRDYNTGFSGGVGLGAVTGDAMINNQNSIVDQSVNQNIATDGGVLQYFGNDSVVASGSGAMAAGGDIDISQELDRSTTIDAGGDILMGGSTKTETTTIDSGNVSNVDIDVTDASQNWDISNSGNEYSSTLTINDSFNETDTSVDYDDWDIDADVVWDSNNIVVGDVDIDG